MRRHRTTPILVLAILHLVGGGLGLILSLCACGGLAMGTALNSAVPTVPRRPGQPPPPPTVVNIYKDMDAQLPGYIAVNIGLMSVSLFLDILLVSGGIGLLQMQPWARWLSLIYATISILYHLFSFVYTLVWVIPATEAMYASNPALKGMSGFASIGGGVGAFFGLLLTLYPIVVLFILLMPSTAAAFRGEKPSRADELRQREEDDRDDEDDDDDDSWRDPPPRSDKFRR